MQISGISNGWYQFLGQNSCCCDQSISSPAHKYQVAMVVTVSFHFFLSVNVT